MIYVASRSPRRHALLRRIGQPFQTVEVDVDETARPGETADALVRRLAAAKASAGRERVDPRTRTPVLGADTLVVLGTEILGKPTDAAEAQSMLARMSGREHRVLSAVALSTPNGTAVRLNQSRVWFRDTTPEERAAYCRTGEPLDKAGAYGIQGRGALFVTRLDGSYSGVMGLPLIETAELLTTAGIALW